MRHHQKYALTASHLTPLFYAVMIAPLGTCPLLLFLTFEPVMYQLVMGVGQVSEIRVIPNRLVLNCG